MQHHKTLGVIPARYASSRFPGKPLVDIRGKSMIRRVYEQVSQASLIDAVIVATDDQRIYDHVQGFGGAVQYTEDSHRSGTDRCAEVAGRQPNYDVVVNIQGDEPFIDPRQIDQVVEPLRNQAQLEIATLAKRLSDEGTLFNPNVVKVVFDRQQKALYFSRSAIPYLRDVDPSLWMDKADFYKHIGIYGFRRSALLAVAGESPGKLEQCESLEQLRWLEAGYRIHVGITQWETFGIDHPEDLKKLKF
jgi:3-deoxy-manno-octulosonate cytidylyltransferase (CMP-KDO synthetase)